jgi:hypothetical protein
MNINVILFIMLIAVFGIALNHFKNDDDLE